MTGANQGIGLEYCKQLTKRGDKIIATCRSSSIELEELNPRIEKGVNLKSQESINKLVQRLKGIKIDILINNAGVLEKENLFTMNMQSIKNQFEVNAIAPLYLSCKLIPNLEKGSKVILMTSRMGSIEDNQSGNYYGYRMSKAALCMAGKSLSIDLHPLGISVALLHPGLVKTQMTNFAQNAITPEVSVRNLINRIDDLNLSNSGSFWHANGSKLPW